MAPPNPKPKTQIKKARALWAPGGPSTGAVPSLDSSNIMSIMCPGRIFPDPEAAKQRSIVSIIGSGCFKKESSTASTMSISGMRGPGLGHVAITREATYVWSAQVTLNALKQQSTDSLMMVSIISIIGFGGLDWHNHSFRSAMPCLSPRRNHFLGCL